ncbi:MAG: hypothetical protein A2096_00900 [Spirochaetes bacterium GWF1_41_5]|nr:MAG: hypothetical protein A2096_00900 [Spirochaetes bacterium GWF1_41_5]HBE02965.1 hypothetical protein [Spirochaetia bacterium]
MKIVRFLFLTGLIRSAWPEPVQWGISFPPGRTPNELAFTAVYYQKAGIKRLRLSENWSLREPKKGSFNWPPLDARVNWADKNHFLLMLTLETEAPDWARSPAPPRGNGFCRSEDDFRRYISALLDRYAGKLDKIQFGNEWDSFAGYNGTAADYLRFHQIVAEETRRRSPQTKVILGGITAAWPWYTEGAARIKTIHFPENMPWATDYSAERLLNKLVRARKKWETNGFEQRFITVLSRASFDILDIHLYDFPEQWAWMIESFRKLCSRPIIVSEFGCPNPEYEKYSQIYQAERLELAMNTLAQLPISEAYHFTLVDHPGAYHKQNGLLNTRGKEKKAWAVFTAFIKKQSIAVYTNR